jgi:hypothetical protein
VTLRTKPARAAAARRRVIDCEIVAAIMGGLGLRGGWQIVQQACGELRITAAGPVAAE